MIVTELLEQFLTAFEEKKNKSVNMNYAGFIFSFYILQYKWFEERLNQYWNEMCD